MKKLVYLLSFTVLGVQVAAQEKRSNREQMAIEVQVDMLQHRLGIAGDLYKVQKYQLPVQVTEKAETVFASCMETYKQLYTSLPEAERASFFKEDFYISVIPVVQYFRTPEYASMMIAHKNALHPRPEAPDPKHHEAGGDHTHN
ncbi:hypothetical protein [Edaphocola aurantiacus]|uniref:hypothetical protein n=1 Tax=Edaphocola aurantiacus TaxID=2601682 RepID=UPI001C970344|nr:hypothetical protein [Edaphocola aurantiacus]